LTAEKEQLEDEGEGERHGGGKERLEIRRD
jgi:hypothetical protein